MMHFTQSRCCQFFTTSCEHDLPVGYEYRNELRPECTPLLSKLFTVVESRSKTSNADKRSSFLTLPPSVRRQIYLYVGIPCGQRVALASLPPEAPAQEEKDAQGSANDSEEEDGSESDPESESGSEEEVGQLQNEAEGELERARKKTFEKSVMSLLSTCSFVFCEMTEVMFSGNSFIFSLAQPGDLHRLRSLGPRIHNSLRQLEIHVHFAPCPHTGGCQHKYGRDKPLLDCQSQINVDMYHEWLGTMKYLARHVAPRSLEIRFLCAVKSIDAAKSVLQPFSEAYIPDLAECVINLHSIEADEAMTSEITTLAHAVSLQRIAWRLKPTQFVQFSALPTELQLHVLKYTDLVTPFQEIGVSSKGGGVVQYSMHCTLKRSICQGFGKYDDGEDCDDDPFVDVARRYFPLRDECQLFCRRQGVDEPRCTCWMPPTALFLVSTSLRRLSQEVFFSRNHFILSLPSGFPFTLEQDVTSHLVSDFLLSTGQQQSLRWLRKLEIVLLPFEMGYEHLGLSLSEDSIPSIEAARSQLNLHLLEITIFIPWHYPMLNEEPMLLDPAFADDMLVECTSILSPLSRLRNMKQFLVIISMPHEDRPWCPTCYDEYFWDFDVYDSEPWMVMDQIQMVERELEQVVMGPDYISDGAQKWPHKTPQLLLDQLNFQNRSHPTMCAC